MGGHEGLGGRKVGFTMIEGRAKGRVRSRGGERNGSWARGQSWRRCIIISKTIANWSPGMTYGINEEGGSVGPLEVLHILPKCIWHSTDCEPS